MKLCLSLILVLFFSLYELNCLNCNAGEFTNSKNVCQLCTSVTANCLSCFDGNGTCEICQGFIPAVNGTCGCNNNTIQVFDSKTASYSCVTPQIAQSYWTNYSTQISQMTENLSVSDYNILYSAALGVNGGATYVCPALEAIGTVLDYGIAEMYTQEKQLNALAASLVLVALAQNSVPCFNSILSSLYSSSNLARFNYTTLKIMTMIGEYHGIMVNKINQFDFSSYSYREASMLISQAEIALDNWKNYMLVYVADAGYLKTYHFSNLYIKFSGVSRNTSISSGLLTNNYIFSISASALANFPANQSIYFVQGVYTSDPLVGYKYTRNVVSNLQSIQFYYSSQFKQANSYLSALTGNQVQFTATLNQTYNVVLDYWISQSHYWQMESNQCAWKNLTVTCNATTLAQSNAYGIVENQGNFKD